MEVAAGLPAIQPDLIRYAMSLTHNRDAAEDLRQDTCERALTKAHLFDGSDNLRPWCFSILRRIHLDGCRTRKARRLADDMIDAVAPQSAGGGQEATTLLREVLEIGSHCGDFDGPLMAMEATGFSVAEMAAHFAVPEGTSKSRVFRARKALREAAHWGEDHGSAVPHSGEQRQTDDKRQRQHETHDQDVHSTSREG